MGERAYLPDTHVLIWLVAQKQIPEHILRVLDADAQILVSAVSVYEVRFKQHLERLDLPALRSRRDWDDLFVGLDAIDLDSTVDHASTAAALDWPHREPWDRILAAQAIVERNADHQGLRLCRGSGSQRLVVVNPAEPSARPQ